MLHLLATLALGSTEDVVNLMRSGQEAAALSASRNLVVETPGDVEAHELLIDLLMNLGLGYQAEDAYGVFVEANDTAMGWYLHGRASVDAEDARAAYEKSLAADPAYARAHMGLASVDRSQGGLQRAEERYKEALELDPSLVEAWAGLAGLLVQQERIEDALALTKRATETVPADPEGWLAAATLDPDNAASWLEAGTKAVPNEPRLIHALATERINAGDVAGAEKLLSRALEIDSTQSQVRADLDVVREINAGRLDLSGHAELARARALSYSAPVAAQVSFDDLVARYPDCYLVHLGRAHLFAEQDLVPQAEIDLRRAQQLNPDSPDVLGALGMLALNENRFEEALPLLVQASAARPGDIELAVSVGLATLPIEGINAAVNHLARVAEQNPTEIAPVMAIVSILSQAGRPDAAYTVLDRALERYPHPTLLLAFAAAAKDLGRNEDAARTLRQLEAITGDAKFGLMADELSAQR
ncbi:MAG TPA: tetratricopeptide repeat protein [Myxococcota bacterium]|nr:tetratricopeptide repeat protein [Myxococcota bacterium]